MDERAVHCSHSPLEIQLLHRRSPPQCCANAAENPVLVSELVRFLPQLAAAIFGFSSAQAVAIAGGLL